MLVKFGDKSKQTATLALSVPGYFCLIMLQEGGGGVHSAAPSA